MKAKITAAELRARLSYEPETGVFRWLGGPRAGRVAGTIGSTGYRGILIDKRHYLAHRLAWLHQTGEWPEAEVDHINRDRDDNRWSNLRAASRLENSVNTDVTVRSQSRLRGAYYTQTLGKYRAELRTRGMYRHLGYFDTAEEAHLAHIAALQEQVGDFARPSQELNRAE